MTQHDFCKARVQALLSRLALLEGEASRSRAAIARHTKRMTEVEPQIVAARKELELCQAYVEATELREIIDEEIA